MRLKDEMPELAGATKWYNSRPLQKRDLIGSKSTLIHYWSVSCRLCKEAMPTVNEFRDAYKGELNVISVHMPRSKKDLELREVKRVADEHGMTQPIFVDNNHTLTNAFNTQIVPAYYVFDKEGRLRHYQAGGGGMKMLHKRISRVLGSIGK